MLQIARRFRIGPIQGLCWGLLFSEISLQATPDLVVNQTRLEANVAVQTRTFASSDCSVVEGCTLAGSRRLLLFDVGIANIGTGDLFIGNPADYPNLFHFSSCHGHYHFDGTAGYELLTTNGQTVVTARKQGFCFRDDALFVPGAGPAKFTCENQGISIGWEDIYDKSLDCQWLDITGVADGDYILRVVANPDGILPELNYTNNVAEVLVTLGSVTPPPPPPPPPPGCTNQPPTTCTNKPPTTCTNKPPKCVNHDDWSKCFDWKKLAKMYNGHYQKKCKIPHCTCKCHKVPEKPGKGSGHGKDDDHDGKGSGGKDDHDGKGNGKDCDKKDDHSGKGGGQKDDDYGGKGGNGGGKDCDNDKGGKGGKGGGKDNDNDHDKGGKDDGKSKGGKGNDKGKGGGKGKNDANCKPGDSGKK